MRNIYQDGDLRPQETPNHQPQAPAQPPQPTPAAQPKLTEQQLAALLQQVLTAQPQLQKEAEAPKTETKLNGLPEGLDVGTRVLYQSADFDVKETPETTDGPKDFASVQDVPMTKSTGAIGSFSVDEIDDSASDIPLPKAASVAAPQGTDLAVEELYVASDDKKAKRTGQGKRVLFYIIMAVCLLAIIGGACWLVWERAQGKQNDDLNNSVNEDILERVTTIDDVGNVIELTDEQMWQQIREQYPHVTFPQNMQFKYARLYARNQDFVGYLEADGIGLSLPVVQTRNDGDYLYKNFDKQQTKYGCPFVSCLNRIDALDTNTVIYGHHMNNNTIFGTLDNYKSMDGYKKAPVIHFNTLYHDYSWKVFAVFITNAEPAEDGGYLFNYFFTNLPSEEKRASYLNELAQRSIYDTGVDVQPGDRLLTLSTCSHEFNEARLVVVARLVRPGESETVDTSRAVWNANPRYPQAWYDSKKKTNPYAGSPRWSVY